MASMELVAENAHPEAHSPYSFIFVYPLQSTPLGIEANYSSVNGCSSIVS